MAIPPLEVRDIKSSWKGWKIRTTSWFLLDDFHSNLDTLLFWKDVHGQRFISTVDEINSFSSWLNPYYWQDWSKNLLPHHRVISIHICDDSQVDVTLGLVMIPTWFKTYVEIPKTKVLSTSNYQSGFSPLFSQSMQWSSQSVGQKRSCRDPEKSLGCLQTTLSLTSSRDR
jgi:hypothetical protein